MILDLGILSQLVSGGVDGAYAVDRLLGTDLLFAAAVAVEWYE